MVVWLANGSSSRNILLKEKVKVKSTVKVPGKITINTTIGDLMINPDTIFSMVPI